MQRDNIFTVYLGMTLLHLAAVDGNTDACDLLISHGCNVNAYDEDGWTPLHAACANGNVDTVRYVMGL